MWTRIDAFALLSGGPDPVVLKRLWIPMLAESPARPSPLADLMRMLISHNCRPHMFPHIFWPPG